MDQGKNILENLDVLNEDLENLKNLNEDTAFANAIDEIIQNINDLKNKLPNKVYQFTTKNCNEYILGIKEIKPKISQLKNLIGSNELGEKATLYTKIDFNIIRMLERCQKKAENKLEEKIKK